jgi:hypothetical protein
VPPAAGPLSLGQASYYLVSIQETEKLKVDLALQTVQDAVAAIRKQSLAAMARFNKADDKEAMEQLFRRVQTIKPQEWLLELLVPIDALRELSLSDEFSRLVRLERDRLNELRSRISQNELGEEHIEFLLKIDPRQLPVEWLVDENTPKLLQSIAKGLDGPVAVLPAAPARVRLDSTTLLNLDGLGDPEVIKEWLAQAPVARIRLFYELLRLQRNLTNKQREKLHFRFRELGPIVGVSEK